MISHPTGLPLEEPSFLITINAPDLDLVWSYQKCFCCEQAFQHACTSSGASSGNTPIRSDPGAAH